jgi:penicillin-insensitive murein endopeptidase
MPPRELTRVECEEMSATMVVADDRRDVDPKLWTPGHFAVIKAAASDPLVQRIFVNPAIKKAMCREASGDRARLRSKALFQIALSARGDPVARRRRGS